MHHVEPFAPMRLFQLRGQDGIGELLTERVDCVAKCFRGQEVLGLNTKLYQYPLVIVEIVRNGCSPSMLFVTFRPCNWAERTEGNPVYSLG